MRTFSWAMTSVLSLALFACGGNTIGGPGTTGGTGGSGAGTTGGTGGVTVPVDYPVPPEGQVYGIAIGNTFPYIALGGGALKNFSTTPTLDCPGKDQCTTSSPNFVPTFTFQDLYFQGKPAPVGNNFRYAFIDISGAWCPHCQQEATDLPGAANNPANRSGPSGSGGPYANGYVKQWLSEGGIVFSILVQNDNNSAPATQTTLFNWVNQYQINYPISIDAEENMVSSTQIKAWPGNVIVRLRDMKVVDSVLGAGVSFYQTFSQALTVCQGDSTIANDCWDGATCQSGVCVPTAN